MRYYIRETYETFQAPTHRAAHRELCTRLRVEGPRALTALTNAGATVHASLYDGEDYIKDRAGRKLTTW